MAAERRVDLLRELREVRDEQRREPARRRRRDQLIRQAAKAGYSERRIAAVIDLSPTRVHEIIRAR